MKNIIFMAQIFIIIFQLFIYIFSSYGDASFLTINISAITPILSFILCWKVRNLTLLKGFSFSVISFFFIMSWIVSFQVPLEVVYGNTALLDPSLNLIYNQYIINKLVVFLSLMLNLFLIGVTYSCNKGALNNNKVILANTSLPTYPLYFLIVILSIIFFNNINPEYLDGGHGSTKAGSTSLAAIGLLIKTSIIYLAVTLFNVDNKDKKPIKFTQSIRPIYLFTLVALVLLFFKAQNRFYPIMLATPILFAYFVMKKQRASLIKIISFFLGLSVFATLFKIYGIDRLFSSDFYIDDTYVISNFFFPFTAELAGSFYSSSILFSLWYEYDFTIYGASFFVGLLRTVPGLVGFINISPINYDSAVIATLVAKTDYGVGTTPFVDLLINFGFYISLVLASLIGYFFGRYELYAYSNRPSIYAYVIFLSITTLILFYPRSSFMDILQMALFSIIFMKVYLSIVKKLIKTQSRA